MNRTLLFNFHKKHGQIGEYSGYEMPLTYKGSIIEHMSVRNSVGVFDVSHMGRLLIKGFGAADLLNRLLTNNCSLIQVMEGRHAFFCNSQGGIIDDLLIFRWSEHEFFMIVNAINRENDIQLLNQNKGDLEVRIEDLTEKVPMIAVQGPKSSQTLQKTFGAIVNDIEFLKCSWYRLDENDFLISRTGYTGEDGFEIYLMENGDEKSALSFWDTLLDAGKEFGIEVCGLVSRDTLRLEAGFRLYGNELGENTTPIEAGLSFGVKIDQRDFIGKDALLRQMKKGVGKKLIGLKMIGRGIPRKEMKIFSSDKEIGIVTSGTLSPTLNIGIAMGYVPPKYALPGTKVKICIRGDMVEAEKVDFPFYDKKRYGRKRIT